jgi:RNA polymerase sigma factor (TIGR02999 family)
LIEGAIIGTPFYSSPADSWNEEIMTASPKEVTQMLLDWSNGDRAAFDRLVPMVYDELRRLANHYMRRERPGQTLQTTALVHEAYTRLVDYKRMRWQDRAHFFAVAAQVMRRILVERARRRQAVKRGQGTIKVSLAEAAAASTETVADILALDEALKELALRDPRKSQLIELRFFGGLNIEETAAVMGLSPTTVQREWRAARAWLYRAITDQPAPDA